MKIGIDIDGCLANFYDDYERVIREVSGKNLFPKRPKGVYPPVWDWPELYGYSNAEVSAAWDAIKASPDFWENLEPMPDMATAYEINVDCHDVYYITARPGKTAKAQTEQWFMEQWGYTDPSATVLISGLKGVCCYALGLDVYVDDRLENILDAMEQSPQTHAYLIDRPYNQSTRTLRRVTNLQDVIDREGL